MKKLQFESISEFLTRKGEIKKVKTYVKKTRTKPEQQVQCSTFKQDVRLFKK